MFKTIKNRVWAFDAEWVPDPVAGRVLYKLPADPICLTTRSST